MGKLRHIAAIDLGIVNDRTAACVVHTEGEIVVLDRLDCWQGKPEDRVKLTEIESWVEGVIRNFNLVKLVLDPWNLEQIAQNFERYVDVQRFSFGGGNHFALAQNLRTLILNHRLKIYPRAGLLQLADGRHEDLVDEMSQLVVEEKTNGTYRLNHLPNKHDDRTICLAMACLAAVKLDRYVDPVRLLEALNMPKWEEKEMDYNEVKKVSCYATYQACPKVDGEELRLMDFRTMHEAAFAVNEVHKLLGGKPVNVVSTEKLPDEKRQAEIRAEVLKTLTAKKLLPLPKVEKKKGEKKEETP